MYQTYLFSYALCLITIATAYLCIFLWHNHKRASCVLLGSHVCAFMCLCNVCILQLFKCVMFQISPVKDRLVKCTKGSIQKPYTWKENSHDRNANSVKGIIWGKWNHPTKELSNGFSINTVEVNFVPHITLVHTFILFIQHDHNPFLWNLYDFFCFNLASVKW